MSRLNCLTYSRRADGIYTNDYSLIFQEHICESYADRTIADVIGVFREKAKGESIINPWDRPVFKEMLSYCKNNSSNIELILMERKHILSDYEEHHEKLVNMLGDWDIRLEYTCDPKYDLFDMEVNHAIQAIIKEHDKANWFKEDINNWKSIHKQVERAYRHTLEKYNINYEDL